LVAIEAMASRTPVVASSVGGLNFSIADYKTGLLVPPQDEVAFAKGIDAILADDDWREALSNNARKRVEDKFSWKGVATQLDRQYMLELSKLWTELGLFVPAAAV
jgi:D-inositol-3-phosphate glycosyltransferase